MKVALFGSTGQLGAELVATAPPQHQLCTYSRGNDGDVTSLQHIKTISEKNSFDVVINAAAYTAVDLAETESSQAYAVNEHGVANLIKLCEKQKARLIHVSTDFVFDGKAHQPYAPSDEPYPLSVYGKSKLAGEQLINDWKGKNAVIFRTSWLYGGRHKNFVNTMISLLQTKQELNVVSDQVGSPTWARTLAKAIWKCVEKPEVEGILHWADVGVASWYDFACAISEKAQEFGMLPHSIPINAIPTEQYPTPAERPRYSVLETLSTRNLLGMEGMNWRSALSQMIKGISNE